MQIELLKNKETKIIEKLIISHHDNQVLKTITNLNLTHDESMVMLSSLEIKWHKIFVDFSMNNNFVEVMKELKEDYPNQKNLVFLLNYFYNFHKNSEKNQSIEKIHDIWFTNYYFWTIFFIVSKNISTNNKNKINRKVDDRYLPVFDPVILFLAEGINYVKDFELFHDPKDAEILEFIFDMNLKTHYEDLFLALKKINYNDQAINLLIFEKEVILKSDLENKDALFWSLKKKTIEENVLKMLENKQHYHNF